MEDRSLYIGRVMVLLFHRLGFAVLYEYEIKIRFALPHLSHVFPGQVGKLSEPPEKEKWREQITTKFR